MPPEETIYLEWWSIYFKLRDISEAYLKDKYDYIFYILRGGMTPAHILSHMLRCKNSNLFPLDIKRHIDDDIDAQTIIPHLNGTVPQSIEDQSILIVEDTIGSGETLSCALQVIKNYCPASIDVVSCGIDHKDLTINPNSKTINLFLEEVFIGFDYWGWLVFPWEKQAYDFFLSRDIYYRFRYQNITSKKKDLEVAFINQFLDKKLNSLRETSTAGEEVLNLLSKVIYAYDQPGNIIVDLYLDINEAALPILQTADYIYPLKGRLIDPWFLKTESIALVIVRGVLASQIGLAYWLTVAKQIHRCLKFDGKIVVNYLDRFKIKDREDIFLDTEYYTPYLMDRLMCKIGFKQDVSQSVGEKQLFYQGFKVGS